MEMRRSRAPTPARRERAGQTLAHLGDDRKPHLADLLAVSEDTIERWTKEARTYEKRAQQDKAWDLWLDCLSERDIAEQVGVTQPTVGEWVKENRKVAEFFQPPASRQHFDVWSFQTASGDSSYFGKMPPQVVLRGSRGCKSGGARFLLVTTCHK